MTPRPDKQLRLKASFASFINTLLAGSAPSLHIGVISTDVGAMSEAVIDGVTGFLVPPDEPEAVAGRILELVRNAPLRAAMGLAGRRRYEEEFTPAVYERNVREILAQVTARRTVS